MSFPTKNAKRRNRRVLGKGQFPMVPAVTTTITGNASTVTLTFSDNVVVSGTIPMAVATRTIVSQTVVSPTVVTILMSGTLTGLAYTLPSPVPNVVGQTGAQVTGGAGTF